MDYTTDVSVAAGLREALATREAGTAQRLQTEVLEEALEAGTDAVTRLLEMVNPGGNLNVLV